MKVLLFLLMISPCQAQWRDIKISSSTDTRAIQENFRRASLWSNRKLDRFGNDTIYGQPIFQNGVKFGDSSIQTSAISTGTLAGLASTQTFTGGNTFIGTTTFTGANSFTATGANGTSISSATITSAVIPTITGNSNFLGTTSTVTFSGWVDIGSVIVSSVSSSNIAQAQCASGYLLTGGGGRCDSTPAVIYSYPNTTSKWFLLCGGATASGTVAYAICARVK